MDLLKNLFRKDVDHFSHLRYHYYFFREVEFDDKYSYQCRFCRMGTGYYHINSVAICETSFNQLKDYYIYINLINEFKKYVDIDCKKHIMYLFTGICDKVQCVKNQERVIKVRNKYLHTSNLVNMDIIGLRLLLAQRNLSPPTNDKNVLISVIQRDRDQKYKLWKKDRNYLVGASNRKLRLTNNYNIQL